MRSQRLYGRVVSGLVLSGIILICSCDSGKPDQNWRIKKAVDELWLVDTHEHFPPEAARLKTEVDFFTLVIGYLQADMISSGMETNKLNFILDNKNPLDERFKVFYPYWQNAKYTGYGKCFLTTIKGLFDIDDLNEETCKIIDEKIKESNREEGWYMHVLKEKCKVDVSIVDPLGSNALPEVYYPSEFFVKVKRFDNFTVVTYKNVSAIGKQYGIEIRTLEDYLTSLDSAFIQAVKIEGIIGIKSGLAYSREIYYEDIQVDEARILFEKIHDTLQKPSADEFRKLEDFMFHQIVARAEKFGLPIQIHTGILSRNFHKNPIENTNAIHLSNLFFKYRNAKFVIFHGSFPYMDELTYLAKHYPNVYIDMCWMYIISPSASKKFLEEWLLTVPSNKIMAFGGDASVEWTYGHATMARQTVTEVLTKMVNDKCFTVDEAIIIANKILRENAIDLYKLIKNGDKWEREL